MKLERIVKTFYDGLEEGKLLGRKCVDCGAVEFPPAIACNECGCFETQWTEMSGKAQLLDFTFPGVLADKPYMRQFAPYGFGTVKMEEGPEFLAVILGLEKAKKAEYNAKLPLPLKAEIVQMDGYKTVFFRIAD